MLWHFVVKQYRAQTVFGKFIARDEPAGRGNSDVIFAEAKKLQLGGCIDIGINQQCAVAESCEFNCRSRRNL